MIGKSCLTTSNTTKALIIDPYWSPLAVHSSLPWFSTLRKDSGPVKLWNAEGSGVALPGCSWTANQISAYQYHISFGSHFIESNVVETLLKLHKMRYDSIWHSLYHWYNLMHTKGPHLAQRPPMWPGRWPTHTLAWWTANTSKLLVVPPTWDVWKQWPMA